MSLENKDSYEYIPGGIGDYLEDIEVSYERQEKNSLDVVTHYAGGEFKETPEQYANRFASPARDQKKRDIENQQANVRNAFQSIGAFKRSQS